MPTTSCRSVSTGIFRSSPRSPSQASTNYRRISGSCSRTAACSFAPSRRLLNKRQTFSKRRASVKKTPCFQNLKPSPPCRPIPSRNSTNSVTDGILCMAIRKEANAVAATLTALFRSSGNYISHFTPYPFFFGAISIILNMSNAILQGFQRTLLAISR